MNDVHTHIAYSLPIPIANCTHRPSICPSMHLVYPSIYSSALTHHDFMYERTRIYLRANAFEMHLFLCQLHTYFFYVSFSFFIYIYNIYDTTVRECVYMYMQHMNSKCKQYFLVLNRNLYD